MIKVKSRGSESVDQLLRRFKKMCEKEGLTKDIKKHAFYEKPSESKRRKVRQAQKREIKTRLGIVPRSGTTKKVVTRKPPRRS
jgi:small subunit ribosomal protein S21